MKTALDIAMQKVFALLSGPRTVAHMTLTLNGKPYKFKYDFGPNYPDESAEFMFHSGNYACDCNLSLFLSQMYPKEGIQEMPCGDEIAISDFRVVHEK